MSAQNLIKNANLIGCVRRENSTRNHILGASVAMVLLFSASHSGVVEAAAPSKASHSATTTPAAVQTSFTLASATQISQGIPGQVVSVEQIKPEDIGSDGQPKPKKSHRFLTGAGSVLGGLVGQKTGNSIVASTSSALGGLLGGRLGKYRDKKAEGSAPDAQSSQTNSAQSSVKLQEIVVQVQMGQSSQQLHVIQPATFNIQVGDQVSLVNQNGQVSAYPSSLGAQNAATMTAPKKHKAH